MPKPLFPSILNAYISFFLTYSLKHLLINKQNARELG